MSKNIETLASTTNVLNHATPTISLPPFMENEAEFWFDVVEMHFNIAGINDPVERFKQAFCALNPKTALLAKDLIRSSWNEESYSKLKERVTSRLFALQEDVVRQRLETETMGDDKPSEFLIRLQNLAGANVAESFVRTIWEGFLPPMVRLYVEINREIPLSKAAEIANLAYEMMVSQKTLQTRVHSLEKELAEIRSRLDQSVSLDRRSRSRSNSVSPTRKRRICFENCFVKP